MSELHLIESTLAKTAARRRLERGFRRLWQGLFIGAAAWLALLTAYKVAPVPDEWIIYSWLALPVSALLGFLWGWSRPVGLTETARWVDGQRKLQERLSTALEVARSEQGGEWKNLVVTDAAKSVSGLNARELLPFHLPRITRWAFLLLVLGVGLGFIPEYRSKAHLQEKQDTAAIQQTGRELASLTKRNLQARPPVLETTKKSLEDIKELGEFMAKAQLTRSDALKDLSSQIEKLKEQTREIGKDPAIRNLERAARSASKSGSPSADMQQKLDNLSKQLGAQAANSEQMEKLKNDLSKAQNMASNLPKGDDTPEAKAAQEQMKASLADLAKQAKDLGLDLPSLSEAIAALQQAQPDQVMKDLQVAEMELEKMEQMAKALEKMQLEMQKLGKDLAEQLKNGQAEAAESTLRKMAEQLNSNKLSPEDMAKVMKEVGEAMDPAKQYGEVGEHMQKAMQNMQSGNKGEAGQCLAKAADELAKMMGELGDAQSLLASLESLQAAAMCIANGQGFNNNPRGGFGMKSGVPKSRSGVGTWTDEDSWAYPEMSESWDNTGIERPDMDGKGISDRGDGQLADSLAPTKIKGQITPGGPMPSITMKGVSIKGNSKIQIQEMATAAQSEAQSALNQDQVPRAYQNAVRNYFDDLKE